MKTWFAALVLIVSPAVAQAQTVTIARGEAVTLTQDDGGVWGADRQSAPDPTPFETTSAARFASGAMDDAVGSNAKPMSDRPGEPPAPVPARGKARFHFVRVSGDHSLLVIENGYDGGLVYRATMRIKGKAEPTDVCLVMTRRLGLEYWPYAIDAIDLSGIRLVPWKDGDPVPCE